MAFNTYAEGLKNASTLANRAITTEASLSTLSPLSSPLPVLQRAFAAYVGAAEAYSHLLSSSLVPSSERANVQRKWRLVLERAEKVKRRIEELGGRVGALEVDAASEEAAVLRRGGSINGVKADVWRLPPDREFTGPEFRDTHQPELAQEQLRLDPSWAPLPPSAWTGLKGAHWCVRQGPGADCSVTAGLGACLAHNERWGTTLGQDSLYPQAVTGHPRPSENAKHIVKLLLNGAWRSVVIDALLPRSSSGAPLHITTLQGRASLAPAWLPLAVKGYFKALGGYSIPGSNPAPDVYAFTGWIPERLDLSSGFQREKEWNRIYKAWRAGQVIVTLGSGRAGEEKGLVKLHAYGVVDVFEHNGERMLHIFDPGTARHAAKEAESATATDAMGALSLDSTTTEGFTMPWDEVCSRFETLNVNWDPALLPVVKDRHWSWPKTSSTDDAASLRSAPRFRITATAPSATSELWLLLSQHQTTKAPLDDVALHVFRDWGGKWSQAQVLHATNPYANALHTLVRFPLREGENVLNAVASRDSGTGQTGFTLRAFASPGVVLDMNRVAVTLPFSETTSGTLTKRSAGGHPGHATHHLNPQYRLAVSAPAGKKATLRFSLQGSSELAWNVKLLWGKGERVFELSPELIVASSGPFSYGLAYAETSVEAGTYTVLVSSWEREQTGNYTLSIESSAAISLSQIPQEGAGMFARGISGKWDAATSGGRPSGNKYALNPTVELVLPLAATVQARLYLPHPAPVPINVTVFKRAQAGGIGEQVATSGPYVEATSGVAVPRTKLAAGVYLVIPSTFESGMFAEWNLDVWADKTCTVELARK